MLYPKESIENKIGFDRIRQQLVNACASSLGVAFVEKMSFTDDFEKVSKLMRQTEEFRQILSGAEPFPASNYIDVNQHLEKAKVIGTFLTSEEFHELQLSLQTIFNCLKFFQKTTEEAYPYLKALSGFVHLDKSILTKINQIIDEKGQIRSNASKELQNIRRTILSSQSRVRKVLEQVIHAAKSNGYVADDAQFTVRGGRMVIPVMAEHKRHIKGFIHDESATGQTVFLEPAEVLEINNEIRDLEYQERREIIRILKELTAALKPYLPSLKTAYHFLGMMDFIRAKAKCALKQEATLPELVTGCTIDWSRAQHPLLKESLEAHGKKIVPLNIQLGSDQRIVVISGPNAGGKSVCLKTVALLQYMMQNGMLIPVDSHSKAGIFKHIFIDIGDEQSLENDLSTYSSHLTNMNYFTKFADKYTLFLIDEFGTGTEPQFGGAIAEAILDNLYQKKAYGVITTHYTNLKQFADRRPGIINAAMAFDAEHLEPLYQLKLGKPGSSYALEIARKIGLPAAIIEEAKEKIGEERVSFDQMLNELEVERKKYQDLLRDTNEKNSRLTRRVQEYEELKAFVDEKKNKIINEAKEEAKRLLNEANQRIEQTIRTIKETQADKQRTQEARKALTSFREQTTVKKSPVVARFKTKSSVADKSIGKGDVVQIKDNGAMGEVLGIKRNTAEILIGSLKSSVKLNRLEKISKEAYRKSLGKVTKESNRGGINLNEKMASFSTNLDLRGKRAEEVFNDVDNFVSDAYMFGMNELRIIHGKGDGILRQVVRDQLKRFPNVKSFHDEHIEQGGSGVTVVELK